VTVATLIGSVFAVGIADAQDQAGKPSYRVGDRWTFESLDLNGNVKSTSEMVVEAVDGDIVSYRSRILESTNPSIAAGQEVTGRFDIAAQAQRGDYLVEGIFRATDFPLSEGKAWAHSYKRRPPNGQGIAEMSHDAKVTGWEEVVVPAGTFKALRIEHTGTWRNGPNSGKEAYTAWYAPDAKRVIKSTFQTWNAPGTRLDFNSETRLISYRIAE
jgi:hypothetical protein